MKRHLLLTLVLGLGLSFLSAPARARGGRPPHGPPPEAFEACEGKGAGDAVEFRGGRGELVEAVCREHDGRLVAVPKDAPERPERQGDPR
ncbi:hypothetical protein [Deferrisoma palaeochoriense]